MEYFLKKREKIRTTERAIYPKNGQQVEGPIFMVLIKKECSWMVFILENIKMSFLFLIF